jgi:hypothetical protein
MPRTGVEPARGINPTRPSTWRVCLFRHLGNEQLIFYGYFVFLQPIFPANNPIGKDNGIEVRLNGQKVLARFADVTGGRGAIPCLSTSLIVPQQYLQAWREAKAGLLA